MAAAPTAAPINVADRPAVTRVALDATSWVDVVEGLVPDPRPVFEDLRASTHWRPGRVWRYERWIEEPRLGAWQRGPGRHPALVEAERWLTDRYRIEVDGVALAYYRDQRDGVAWHRDREMRWLDDTIVGVLTFGARRPWRLRPLRGGRPDDDLSDAVELRPAAGDLLVMGGRCQADWLHTVPRLPQRCEGRISAQWRWTSRRGRRDTQPGYFAPRQFSQ